MGRVTSYSTGRKRSWMAMTGSALVAFLAGCSSADSSDPGVAGEMAATPTGPAPAPAGNGPTETPAVPVPDANPADAPAAEAPADAPSPQPPPAPPPLPLAAVPQAGAANVEAGGQPAVSPPALPEPAPPAEPVMPPAEPVIPPAEQVMPPAIAEPPATPPVIPAGPATEPPQHYHETGGFATGIEAGLGGKVIKVTNLNGSGEGSLAAALGASGKRLVVFEVGGVINLEGNRITVGDGDLTIAGQTAPAPGITLIRGTLQIAADNVVVSHIGIRPGDGDGGEPDGMEISSKNVVVDHVSISWAIDEGLTLKGAQNITFFKSSISQQLSHSTHSKPEHSKATLIYRGSSDISLIGCLFAHNSMRNPRISDGKVMMTNSVVYNWGEGKDEFRGDVADYNFVVHLGDNGESDQIPEVSFVGNVGLSGPDSKAQHFLMGHKTEMGKAYMDDNIILDTAGAPLFVADDKIIPLDMPPIWPEGYEVMPAHEGLYELLRTVGPRPAGRSAADTQIVGSVAQGNGEIIDSQDEVGGYPTDAETQRPLTVPDGVEARKAWLDSLEDELAVDAAMDLSRLYQWVGSESSDRFRGFSPAQ